MRVLHCVSEVEDAGNGIVNVAVDLAIEQAGRSKFSVAVASRGGSFEPLLKRSDVETYHVPHLRNWRKTFAGLVALQRALNNFAPDVVHCHTLAATVAVSVLRPLHRYRVITTVHNEYQPGVRVMGLADKVVCVSEAVRFKMRRRGVPCAKLVVVYNGTIGNKRRPSKDSLIPIALAKPAIVSVGAVSPRKGSMLLLEAYFLVAAKLPAVQLYFVGNVDQPEVQQRATKSRYAKSVHFVGFSSTPQSYIRAADVFVLASFSDPFPLVLLEAREVGAAIVASRADGIPEALDHGAAGLLVPSQEPHAYADAILKLLDDHVYASDVRRNAMQGMERFSVRGMTDGYLQVYDSNVTRQ